MQVKCFITQELGYPVHEIELRKDDGIASGIWSVKLLPLGCNVRPSSFLNTGCHLPTPR